MNNEPVAWAIKTGDDLIEFHTEMREFQETVDFYKMEEWDFEEVPLYTHPAKTLTDEEIGELIGQYSHYEDWEGFAKAILRKAQEK